MSIYMNQFPYTGLVKATSQITRTLSEFDAVIFNSAFSEACWHQLTEPVLTSMKNNHLTMPVRHIIHPAVELWPMPEPNVKEDAIMMVGRFFEGRQEKHHIAAIEAFAMLKNATARRGTLRKVSLYLVGGQMPGHEDYVARVRSHAAAVSGVHVMTDVSSDVLAAIVAKSSVVWSMTGWGTPVTQDPAKCVLCSQLARCRNKQ